jgi:hypothetical protein
MTTPLPVINMDSDPRLIVGWRDGRNLTGRRVALDKDVFPAFRAIAEDALGVLDSTEARPYEPFAELDKDVHHFAVELSELPTRDVGDQDAAQEASAAALLAVTSSPDSLETISPDALGERPSYLFYGLVFDTNAGGTVLFIKKTDPVRAARSTRVGLLMGRDVLKLADPPALTLAHNIDLVVTPTQVLVMNKSAFDQLLNDVAVALQDVPQNVERTVSALATTVTMGTKATESLGSVASKRPSVAVRLRRLPDRLSTITITPDRVRERLAEMGNQASDLLDGDEFSFPKTRVALFLDMLEGRHFDDEWTGERMKADRMSRHTPN